MFYLINLSPPSSYNRIKIGHPIRVSNFRQNFSELNVQELDSSKGYKSADVQKFEKIKTLSISIFELSFNQDQNK